MKLSFFKNLLFFAGVWLLVFFSGTEKINHEIANKGLGYFVLKNIDQANESGKLGYIKYELNDYAELFKIPFKSGPGVRRIIRSGPEDHDDIGYVSLLSMIAISGKKITLGFVEKFHNYAFILSFILLAFIVKGWLKSIPAGWACLAFLLILKSHVLSFVYGHPESRTFAIFFPFLLITMVIFAHRFSHWLIKWPGLLILFTFGWVAGWTLLIRNAEGMPVFYTLIFSVLILRLPWRQRLISLTPLFAGYLFVVLVLPALFALHRDLKTGEFPGTLKPYLQTTGQHPAWHSLVLGLGKYPNSLGMRYDDLTCYNIVRARYPWALHPTLNYARPGYYDVLRKIYIDYVARYPGEYLLNLFKSYAELSYFIPYATSAGNLSWDFGYLPPKRGANIPVIDRAFSVSGIINLKWKWLKLGFLEWLIFLFAAFIILAASVSALRIEKDKINKRIFLSLLFYLFLLSIQRTIVPMHGLAMVMAFWTLAILSFLYLISTPNLLKWMVTRRIKFLVNFK